MTGLAEGCRALLQGGVLLLLAATPLLGAGLFVAARLRRSGDPPAAVAVLRLSLVCLSVCAPLLLLPPLSLPAPRSARLAAPPSAVPAPVPRSDPASRSVVVLPAPPPPIVPAPRPTDFSRAYVAAAAVWGGVSLALLLGLLGSHVYLLRLRRTATPLPAESAAARVLQPGPTAPLLLTHPRVTVPFAAAASFARPAIFLPADGGASWDAEALPAVLAHEAAHLRRGDFGWNLLARLALALLWPQPLVWLLLRRLEEAQELTCDAEALTAAGPACRPRAYADCLVNLAERHGTPAWERRTAGTAAVSRRSLLEERIRRIMESRKTQTRALTSRRARIAVASGAATLLGVTVGGSRLLSPVAGLPSIPAPAVELAAAAQVPPAPSGPLDARLSVDFRDSDLTEALRQVLAGSGLKLYIAPEVEKAMSGFVTLRTSDRTREETIRMVLRSSSSATPSKVRWLLEGDTVRVLPTDFDKGGLPRKTVTLNYPERALLVTVLDDLFSGAGGSYVLGQVPRDATTRVRVEGVPFRTALEAVLRGSTPPLSYRVGDPGSISIFDAAEKARAEGETARRRAALDAEEDAVIRRGEIRGAIVGGPLPSTRVSVEVKDAALRSTLEQLFHTARLNFSIDYTVQGVVTAKHDNEPLDVVLPALLRQSPTPLLCRFENNVLIIRPPRPPR